LLDLERLNNPYGEDKVMANCSIFGMMDMGGRRMAGGPVFDAMANMRERSNGLGGGFSVYGLYPDHSEDYAFHVMFDSEQGKSLAEAELSRSLKVVHEEEIPTQPDPNVVDPPVLWRYFIRPPRDDGSQFADLVAREVTRVNSTVQDAFVFSAARNMGVFKGIGYPEDLSRFYRLDDYKGYMWLAHGRFPTNTIAWWGGAHPFSILDWSVVHNGEISSYGANKRFVEDHGYRCTFHTDTEVVAYAVDLLVRRHGLTMDEAAKVLAPPLWDDVDRMEPGRRRLYTALRSVYAGLLLNGPFSVIIGREGEMVGLTDRIRLRPLTAGLSGDVLYLSSEEAPMTMVSGKLDRVWSPRGGVPIIGRIGEGLSYREEA
jgi:glutamate synthase domain-containing protein 1